MTEKETHRQLLNRLLSIDNNKLNSNKVAIVNSFESRLKTLTLDELEKIEKCSAVSGYLQRVVFMRKYFEYFQLDPAIRNKYAKNNEISMEFIKHGDKSHLEGLYEEAVKSFTLALLFAIPNTEDIRLIYSKRSLSFEALDLLEEAMNDIDLALGCKHSSWKRMFENLRRRRKKLYAELRSRLTDPIEDLIMEKLSTINKTYHEVFSLLIPSPVAGALEDCIVLKHTPERGRHMITTVDVPIGTTLLVETPVTSVLVDGLNWDLEHCHHCHKNKLSLIPCPGCVFALYCSDDCLANAYKLQHKYECSCLPELHCSLNPKMGTHFHLAFKVLCILGTQRLVEVFQNMRPEGGGWLYTSERRVHGIPGSEPETGVYKSKSFRSMYCLSANKKPRGSVHSILISLMLAHTLDYNSAFTEYASRFRINKEDFLNFISELILHHYERIRINSYSASHMEGSMGTTFWTYAKARSDPNKNIIHYKMVESSEGIYTTASLINHSCNPNLMRVFGNENGIMALISIRSLKAGQELLVSYGPQYPSLESGEERRRFLKETFNFTCHCIACENNWPPIEELIKIPPSFSCPRCSLKFTHEQKASKRFLEGCKLPEDFKCVSCGSQYDKKDFNDEYVKHCEMMKMCKDFNEGNKPLHTYEYVRCALRFFDQYVCPPDYYSLFLGHIIYREAVYRNALYATLNVLDP